MDQGKTNRRFFQIHNMDDDSDAYKYCRLINDISYIFISLTGT